MLQNGSSQLPITTQGLNCNLRGNVSNLSIVLCFLLEAVYLGEVTFDPPSFFLLHLIFTGVDEFI